jgi:hypothetical protein
MSAFLDESGELVSVSASNPLPVTGGGGGGGGSDPNAQLTKLASGDVYTSLINAVNVEDEYCVVQVKNPTDSGIKTLIYSINILNSNVSTQMQYFIFKTSLEYTLLGYDPVNMNVGSANTASTEIRTGTDTGAILSLANAIDFGIVDANKSANVFENPILLDDGESVAVVIYAENQPFSARVIFAEV